MKKILTVLLFAELFLLFSCQNAFNSLDTTSPSSDQKIKITRYFDFSGAVPQNFIPKADSNNKTAFPSVSPGTTTYKAILKNLTDGTTISTDDNPSPAEISIDAANKAISLELTVNKQYVITVQCVNYYDPEIVYLEGSCDPFTLTPTHTVFSETFILQPVMTGNGQVDLPISFSNEVKNMTPTIQIVRVRNLITGQEVQNLFKITLYLDSNKAILVSGNETLPSDIPAGQYSVEIEFRDSIQRIYFIKEVVNIFNNLVTNTFVKNTDEEYYQPNASNKIEIYVTEEMTKRFISSTKYVDSNSTSQSEEGTWTNPYKTLAQAIAAIPSDSTHGYIHIKDGHSEEIDGGFDITQNMTIECYKDMPGDGKGNATFKFVSIGSLLFYIRNTCANFDITGITLDGNLKDSECEGLFINVPYNHTSAQITATNCTVKNCKAVNIDSGAAIRNSGTLTLDNCILKYNEINIEENNFDSTPGRGGAIYNDGTLTLNNTEITDNTAYIGGGVYTTKPIKVIGKTIIKDNKAKTKSASPVYSASNLYLAKGTGATTPQSYIDCTDSIPASGSEIHITTETKPTVAEPVTVLKNFYSHSGCKPEDFFISDEDYPIVKNGSTDNACLKIGGGELTVKTFDDIKISIDKKLIKKSDPESARSFTFTVSDGTTTHTQKDSDVTEVNIYLYKNEENYQTTSIATNSTFSMLFPAKKTSGGAEYDMPFGIYTAIASVTYKNKTYQAAFDIEYCDTYPSLKYVNNLPEPNTTYAVSTADDLKKIYNWTRDNRVEFNIEITNDIIVDNSFSGIGTTIPYCFIGEINGNGHTISGLTAPLIKFGFGKIKNLTIEGNIRGKAAFIENFTSSSSSGNRSIEIDSCINKATITSSSSVGNIAYAGMGAFVGTKKATSIIIKNCINYGDIIDSIGSNFLYMGGISGCEAVITNCANYGNVSGSGYVGGITPRISKTENCVNYGNITGRIAGGISGDIYITSPFTDSYSIHNCVNFGTITGTGTSPSIGQLIGKITIDTGEDENLFHYDWNFYLKGKDSTGADYKAVGSSSGYNITPQIVGYFEYDPTRSDYKVFTSLPGYSELIVDLNEYVSKVSGCCQWKLDKSIPPKPMLDFSTITP